MNICRTIAEQRAERRRLLLADLDSPSEYHLPRVDRKPRPVRNNYHVDPATRKNK